MVAKASNITAVNPDVVDVQMPASMSEYLRLMGELLIRQTGEGQFVLRHGKEFWVQLFEAAMLDDGPPPELAYEHLQAVLSDWNQVMTLDGCPTPLPI